MPNHHLKIPTSERVTQVQFKVKYSFLELNDEENNLTLKYLPCVCIVVIFVFSGINISLANNTPIIVPISLYTNGYAANNALPLGGMA